MTYGQLYRPGDGAMAAKKLRQLQMRLMRDGWRSLAGHRPTPDEMTLLAEAFARHGTVTQALAEVWQAVDTGRHPVLMD